MAEPNSPTPITFYLNEQHELSRGEKESGGRVPQYHGIDWATKGHQISSALESVKSEIRASKDPLRDSHYFVLAKPVAEVQKKSKNKKLAPDGIVTGPVRFDERESRVFRRLGIDLVEVTESGDAIVHIRPERLERWSLRRGCSTRPERGSKLDGPVLIRSAWFRRVSASTTRGLAPCRFTSPPKRLSSSNPY